MEEKLYVLIDTNVLLDYLDRRIPFAENAGKIVKMAGLGKIKGIIAAHGLTTIWYILRKKFTDGELREMLLFLLSFMEVSGVNHKMLVDCLNRDDFSDFEDCVQDECAAAAEADYIVTRNKDDFESSKVPALTPEEFVKKYA